MQKETHTRTILISQDDSDDRFIFKTAFSELEPDAELHFFFTASELFQYLLKILSEDAEKIKSTLVVGDFKVPFFDLKDIQTIRSVSDFDSVPIFVFAESFSDVCKTRAMNAGASAFFTKPDSFLKLKEMIQNVLIPQVVESKKVDDPITGYRI